MNRLETKKLESNLWKIYLVMMLRNLVFFVPVCVLFWQDNGLNMTQIMILQSLYAIGTVVLEIPTGYIADIYGRKKSLIYSAIAFFVAISIYSVGTNFWIFLLGELVFAVAASLISGANEAFVYDTLIDLKREEEYKKIWGHAIFLSMIAIAVANIAGGFIGQWNLRATFYLMLPFLALMIPVSLTLNEPKRHKLIFEKNYVHELFKIIKFALFENRKLKWLIIYGGIAFGFNQAILWFYQPYFSLSGLDIVHFGFVFASFQIVAAIFSKYAHKIEEKIGEKYSLFMFFFFIAGSYILMSNFIYWFSFIFGFLNQFIRGFSKVVMADYINKLTKSNIRATVLSIYNMFKQLAYALIIPIAGYIADVYSLLQALTVLGITTFVVGIIMIIVLIKTKTV